MVNTWGSYGYSKRSGVANGLRRTFRGVVLRRSFFVVILLLSAWLGSARPGFAW